MNFEKWLVELCQELMIPVPVQTSQVYNALKHMYNNTDDVPVEVCARKIIDDYGTVQQYVEQFSEE